jgi:serine kinase of HPr protein (carbohydrate metabolism regulator)
MSRYMTPIHAACVSLNGQGVLLCGDSGAGKSSLSFACARRGWTFIADDASSLVRNRSERIVVGNPHQIRFRESAVALFPELRYERLSRRVSGEMAIELPTSSLAGIDTALQASVDHIVFLNRKPFARVRVSRLQIEQALPWFEQVLTYGEPDLRDAQKASLHNLLTANLIEMTYSDLDSAVDCLESMVRGGA